jgi:hypothetical protein
MAPHDTDTRREARRHRWPLIVMAICVLVAVIGLYWYFGYETEGEADPVPGTAEIEDLEPAPAEPTPAQ